MDGVVNGGAVIDGVVMDATSSSVTDLVVEDISLKSIGCWELDIFFNFIEILLLQFIFILMQITITESEESLVALKEQGTVKKQLKYDPATQSPFVETNPPTDNEKPDVIEKVTHEDFEKSFPSKTKEQFEPQQQPSAKIIEKFISRLPI
uniref:Uncharacterized protein n=1 Tax=Glossina palpalis gambiensis TaxID=67801 RepID=A0A1B0BFT9_9MUSC